MEVVKGTPADKAGMQPGDRIVAVNGVETAYYQEVRRETKRSSGKPVSIDVVRNDVDTVRLSLTPTQEGTIGVQTQPFFKLEKKKYTALEAIPEGIALGWSKLSYNVKALGQMITGETKASDSLGGFASIASIYGNQWVWEHFWSVTAMLSLVLAFMNLLPIPALDGGHVLFLLYEVATGKKPSDKFMEVATTVGFILVLSLLLYANGLDIFRAWFK
jgi:regulator of sigma E protease